MRALTSFEAASALDGSDVLAGVQPGKGGRKFLLSDLAAFFGPGGGASGVASFNSRSGTVTLTSGDVIAALTYTPQPSDADLTAIAALTTTAFGRGFLDLVDAAAGRAKLGLGSAALSASGDFQPADADLTAIAALTTTAYGRALLALADGAALTALGDTFTLALKGLVPASGGGSSNFLRADGAWAAPGGGSDPWTTVKLAADYNNALNTFQNINDGTATLTFTPAANTDWELEARLLIWTTAAANLPRIGVAVGAGASRGYGACNIWQPGATATASVHANGGWADGAGVTVVQLAAGGVLTASVPYECEVIMAGRSGASPTAITMQMACETAAVSTCYVKRGSFLKYRTF